MTTNLKLGDVITLQDTLPDELFRAVWIDPASREIYRGVAGSASTFTAQLENPQYDDAVLIFWGIEGSRGISFNSGNYLPYPPLDGEATEVALEPVNQVPYLREFLQHCCTFAHELLTDHQPHAPRLRHVDAWNIAPDLALDVASIEKNRVGMRYYRGVIGYFFDQLDKFEAMPGDVLRLGQFDENWQDELPILQALDKYVCGECRDESGGSRLRDFIHYCNVSEWDNTLTAVEQLAIGSAIQYRARLPKIDRSNPDNLRPHATRNVRDWVSNVPSVDSGWRSMMRDFDAAVKRYDRDPSVRMQSANHIP